MAELPDPGSFGAAFSDFMHAMQAAAVRPDPEILVRLRDHLGVEPRTLPATIGEFSVTDRANLQLALDAVIGNAEVLGFQARHAGLEAPGIAEVAEGSSPYGRVHIGPVRHTDVEVGDGRVIKCVTSGLFLARHDDKPVALVIAPASEHNPMHASKLRLEGISPEPDLVSKLLRDVRAAMREHNVFRGRVISLHADRFGALSVKFHTVPQVRRDEVILPPGTLDRLDTHAIGITARAAALRSAGRHLKRGILLHGPPGTGKTLTATYLLGAMRERTTILLTGPGLGLIESAVGIARDLAPATVVFEDIDLVAGERTMHIAHGGILFELLNQMEGIAEDEDLLFLLTTNRPDLIEPALAARPGRVDLALEMPLPDEDGRKRLLRLYGAGIELDDEALAELATRSAGVSGAFIKELVRQAWLRSAIAGRSAPTGEDLTAVLDELMAERSGLTRRLLGQQRDEGSPDSGPLPPMLHAMRAAGLPVPDRTESD
jgi:cell division protease FtsH